MVNYDTITALDIGSSCVRVIICERDEDGSLKIMGVGEKPSTGLRKGSVVNIEATLRAISSAIEEAETMSGIEVHDCWVGIGGSHTSGINSKGVVGVAGKKRDAREREIDEHDIERVIEAARAVVIPTDKQILEVIPQNYKVDEQKGIRNPLDMIGVRLECEAHIVICTITGAQNLVKCVNRAGFSVNELILQTLASGRAVLTQDEIDLGVVLIDLGAGTTDTFVYVDGAPYSTHTIPAGGSQVTNDISIIKSISNDNAEKIKIDSGCCWDALLDEDDSVIVPGVGGRAPLSIPRSQIMKIIKPRVEELFKMIRQHIDTLNLTRPLGGGVVLTGGGAQLSGVVELANNILGLPARIGAPIPVQGLKGLVEVYRTPSFSTVVGLALEGAKRAGMAGNVSDMRIGEKKNQAFFDKLRTWLKEEFF